MHNKPITSGEQSFPIKQPSNDKKHPIPEKTQSLSSIPVGDLIRNNEAKSSDIDFKADSIKNAKNNDTIKEIQSKGLSVLGIKDNPINTDIKSNSSNQEQSEEVDLDASIDLSDEPIPIDEESSVGKTRTEIYDHAKEENPEIDLDASIDLSDDTTIMDRALFAKYPILIDCTELDSSEIIKKINDLVINDPNRANQEIQFKDHPDKNICMVGNIVVVAHSELSHFMENIYDKHDDFKKSNISQILVVHDKEWETLKPQLSEFVSQFNSNNKRMKDSKAASVEEAPTRSTASNLGRQTNTKTTDLPNLQKTNKRKREARREAEEDELARQEEHDRIRHEKEKDAIAKEKNIKIERSENFKFELNQKRIKTEKNRKE
jgi:hypothetical protein